MRKLLLALFVSSIAFSADKPAEPQLAPPPTPTPESVKPAEPPKPEERPVVRGGAIVGLNLANASFNPDTPSSSKLGYSVGPVLEFRLQHTYLQIEVLSAQYGFVVPASGSTPETVVSYDTIDVPITAKYRFDVGEVFHPLVLAGGSFAFRLNHEGRSGATVKDLSDTSQSAFTSFVFGAGAEFDVTHRDSIFLAARYLLGASDVSRTSTSAKQATLQFVLGYIGGF